MVEMKNDNLYGNHRKFETAAALTTMAVTLESVCTASVIYNSIEISKIKNDIKKGNHDSHEYTMLEDQLQYHSDHFNYSLETGIVLAPLILIGLTLRRHYFNKSSPGD